MDSITLLLLIFVLGTAIGSFLNVVVYRLPESLSLLYPPSCCPKCGVRLKLYDNVPVFGWFWLGGRCRNCKQPIAFRYPLVEFATGGVFVLVFTRFGLTWQTPCYWIFLCWLLVLALIDLDTMTLPNRLTASGLILGWGFQGSISYLATPTLLSGMSGVVAAFFSSIFGLWLFDLIGIAGSSVFGKTAMGGGDSKLAAMMAAWLGWPGLLLATFLAAAMGSLIGGSALVLGMIDRKQQIPFGPYLALGATLTLFYGQQLIDAYLSIFFPLGL
nr:A24 family peptidase [Synechococcus sp. PCC 7335]